MKDQKMLSFRLNSAKFEGFKNFCTSNNLTIKDVLTKCVEIILEADKLEKNEQILFPNKTAVTSTEEF